MASWGLVTEPGSTAPVVLGSALPLMAEGVAKGATSEAAVPVAVAATKCVSVSAIVGVGSWAFMKPEREARALRSCRRGQRGGRGMG